jgi:DNA-binding IscR family transcriptional regulator
MLTTPRVSVRPRFRMWGSVEIRAACLAILAELEREFFAVRSFTELEQSTGLPHHVVEAALTELKARRLVEKGIGVGGRKGYQRVYVPDAKPIE